MSASDLATVLEENAILRRECGRIAAKCDEAREERDEAIRERDEARREACLQKAERMKLLGHSKPVQYLADSEAYQRAWDCFDLGNFHAHNSAIIKSGSYSGKTR